MDLKKMQNVSEVYVRQFMKAATELVMDEVGETDDENKKTIAMFTARDMAIGSMIKRNEHILTGVGIGVIGTTLAFTIGGKIKKRKKKDKVVVYDMDTDEVSEEKEEVKQAFEQSAASEEAVAEEQVEEEQSIIDKVNDILKKPQNLDDLKSVIEELRSNEK